MARTATGIDIGARTAKYLRGEVKGNTFIVRDFAVTTHRAKSVAAAWEEAPGFKPTAARVGLTGRDVNIRYTRVPRLPDWQLRKLMRFEVDEVGGQSGAEVASDFNVLPEMPEIEGEDVVLLAMARESMLEEHAQGLASQGGSLDAFAPNALALYNAWLHYGVVMEDTVLVANLGHENLDVILARGTDLVFARNLTGGSKLFDDAIVLRFSVGPERAEEIKIEMVDLTPGASFDDPSAEKASRAVLGAGGQVLSLLQSAIVFCKSQVKLAGLKVDRVQLCGGGAALRGLDRYLSAAMGVPVEIFDPFRVVDLGKLAPEAAEALEDHRLEAVCALGLATMGSDPDAYSVEILPAREKRKREFVGGTLFLIAAAVLASLYIGWKAVKSSEALGVANAEAVTQGARLRKARNADTSTRTLLAENAELAALVTELQTMAGSGEQAARALGALEGSLSQDFWLTEMVGAWGADPELGVERGAERPLLHFAGRTREGTESVSLQFQEFVEGVRDALPGAVMKESMAPSGRNFEVDLTLLAPPAPPSDEGDEDAENNDESDES